LIPPFDLIPILPPKYAKIKHIRTTYFASLRQDSTQRNAFGFGSRGEYCEFAPGKAICPFHCADSMLQLIRLKIKTFL